MATISDILPQKEPGPNTPSADHAAMQPYWRMVDAILGGKDAMQRGGVAYLPRFENESDGDYSHRLAAAPFTNIYADISRNLASKPFSREVRLGDGAPAPLIDLCEDIDGQGNHLHVFAAATFKAGLDKGIDWILVDYPPGDGSGRPRTVAEERRAGLRPYWVHIPAERMLAVYSDFIAGREAIVHARVHEPVTVREGFGERVVDRVRVFERSPMEGGYGPATYQLYEKRQNADGSVRWDSIEGPAPLSIGVIPLVPFLTGDRLGATWQVRPPLKDIAYLQIEEYQQESNLKNIHELTCFPMLAGQGISAPVDETGRQVRVPVGPRAVLFAPPNLQSGTHGEWKYIEPASGSLERLAQHLEKTQTNMRDLGMLPMTQANLTVISAAGVALKANSAVQAWALRFKDALEQAFVLTALWLGLPTDRAEVDVYTDFGVRTGDSDEMGALLDAAEKKVVSRRTARTELKRRGLLSEDFDADADAVQLRAEADPEPVQPGT
ncbi:DUF4055 domain-containing protein [Roseomonas chloroacetimidivorans]|uniref:DUF4055 domain-containing protein n=1 Tax=Roseomonas chloroacetimidivorans TaxID=1766656 RepID=UPI003C754C9B